MAKIKFFGGAREVSGACYLLEMGKTKILVDCGMTQGSKFAEKQNYEPFPFNPKEIDFVLVTHANIDHTGRLPKLVKEGFRGKIFSTYPTKDFSDSLLKDSAGLIAKEAAEDNHLPFFQESDVETALKLWQGVEYNQEIELAENFKCIFKDAGHILGSAIIQITFRSSTSKQEKIVFSGDLGNSPAPLLQPTEYFQDIDYIVVESAYGDRLHESVEKSKKLFAELVKETFRQKGVVMVPAFAVERTQELLYDLNELVENNRLPKAPILIDSPLAFKITEVYRKYIKKTGDDVFEFPGLKFTPEVEDSKKINDIPAPKMIIAGSGMMQGGRILHHLMRYLPDPKNLLLIVGYQANNSLGQRLLQGVNEVRIFNTNIPVSARIVQLSGFSAHADQAAILNWIKKATPLSRIKKVFVVQGDEKAALALVQKIDSVLGIEAVAPLYKDEFEI